MSASRWAAGEARQFFAVPSARVRRITSVFKAVGAASVGLALLAASPACADGWSQIYVGGGVGADAVTLDASITSAVSTDVLELDGLGGGDFGASIRVGADLQVSSLFVLGVFANYDWSNIDTKASLSASDGAGTTEDYAATLLDVQYAWALGGRVGFIISPATLAYGLAGYTRVAFDDPSIGYETRFNGVLVDSNGAALNMPTFSGIVFGGGFEHKLTNTVSVWGEYRQSRLGEERIGVASSDAIVSLDPVLHTGRLGVSYRFGGQDAGLPPAHVLAPAAFTGIYVGAGGGADGVTGELELTHTDAGAVDIDGKGKGIGGGNIAGTLTAGYDASLAGGIIAGVFGNYDRSAQDVSINGILGSQTVSANLPSVEQMWTAGGRVGAVIGGDLLAYALAGYSRLSFSDLKAAVGNESLTLKSQHYGGVTLGGGLEKLISDNFAMRAEYRYAMFGEKTIYDNAENGVVVTSEPDLHSLRLMAVYRFNGPD